MSRERSLARDARARRRAQEEFDTPIVVEAGAGTGKTATLVARILAWTLDVGWERAAREMDATEADDEAIAQSLLGGIVAITFTEAAAAEMATRLGRALTQVAGGDADAVIGFDPDRLPSVGDRATLAPRARALLANLDHLTARTIHAFCRSLLAAYPLESGVHPDFVVDADGSRRRAILREVVEAAVLTSYSREASDPLSRLATAGVGPDTLFEALDTLLREGAQADLFRRDPFDADGVRLLCGGLSGACRDLMAAGGESLRATSGRSKRTAETLAAIEATRRLTDGAEAGDGDVSELIDERARTLTRSLRVLWDDGTKARLGDWRRGSLNRSESDVFAGDPTRFASASGQLKNVVESYGRIDLDRFSDARLVIQELLESAAAELRAAGVMTFAGLLAGAQRLLASEPAVLARERARIDQLLVDEFQDTDPRQCEIVRLLALDEADDTRPGLFIVGDPKQSIYGWREADLQAYDDFLAAVETLGGERHLLTRNFRSTAAVLAEVDRVMRPSMTAAPGLQPRYEPLVPEDEKTDPEAISAGAAVEHWIAWTGFDGRPLGRADEVAQLEAEAVARDLERYRRTASAPWSDCAVLFRGRGQLDGLQDALRSRGIPYAVSRDVGYYRRREVIEAAALVRTVLNPTDHLALVTWLRSVAVGVPDAALLPLWRRNLPDLVTGLRSPADPTLARLHEIARQVAAELPTGIPGLERIRGWEENLIAGFELVAAARELAREAPADRLVEELRRRSLLEVTEAARYQGEYRIANLERFFRDLESALVDPRRGVEGVLQALRTSIRMQPDAEEAKPQGPEEDAVQLMTIHVAKGLEFRSVWLVQLHAAARGFDRGQEPVRFDRRDRPDTTAPAYELFGWPTPSRHRTEEREARVEEAERVRTLYVAMTRARERLVLSGNWPTGAPPGHWSEASCQVELLQMRDPAPPPLPELWAELAASGGSTVDDDGVRWAFPALDPDAGVAAPPRGAAAPPPVRRWADEADSNRRDVLAARQRSARPLHTAASSLHGDLSVSVDNASPGEREAALRAGTLIHRALEGWRFDRPTHEELARARADSLASARSAPGAAAERTARRLGMLFDRMAAGTLLDRLAAIEGAWSARELPLISPVEDTTRGLPSDSVSNLTTAPIEAYVGSIDLLYRDLDEERWVIVDFKTDIVDDGEALASRAAAYAPQLEIYRRAVGQALPDPRPPRCELWFLWPDRVVRIDHPPGGPTERGPA